VYNGDIIKKEVHTMKNNAVYQRGIGAKHFKSFTPLFNFGRRVIIGKYGTMAMEYLKETQPKAYEAYSAFSEFKYILAGINDEAAKRLKEIKLDLKRKYPAPETDDFFRLAKHNRWIEGRAEKVVIDEVVNQPYILDDEVLRVDSARHARALN